MIDSMRANSSSQNLAARNQQLTELLENEEETKSSDKVEQTSTRLSSTGRVTYPVEEAPRCDRCRATGPDRTQWFDFGCPDCVDLVASELTTVPQLLAIVRQWIPTVQVNIDILVRQVLQRGAHPDDRDALTDMTLLHYVCKSGAAGIGDVDKSLQTVVYLVEKCGSDPGQRCRLNSMTALHLAAYFDVAPIVGYLVSVAPNLLNSNCAAHPDSPTPLHLAAANLSLHSARILLSAGANILLKDDQMRTPLDCVPEVNEQNSSDAWYRPKEADLALDMRALLEEATLMVSGEQGAAEAETMRTAKVVLAALGLDIGHRVVVGNAKVGILRYCGPTQFASGIWTGVELEEQVGKNDGSVAGVSYFRCAPGYGIFAPIDKISKLDTADCYDLMLGVPAAVGSGSNGCRLNGDHSMVQSKIDTGLTNRSFPSGAGPRRHSDVHSLMSSSSSSSVNSEHIHLGSRVLLTDRKTGIVRFIGTTKFAAGIWYGIELSRQLGKHDGSIQGVRYFRCPDRYGAFVQFGRIAQILPPSRGAASRKTVSSFVDSSAAGAAESDDTSLSDMTDMSLTISGTSSLDYFHAGNPHRNGPSTASVSSLCRNQPTRNSIAGSTALRQSVGGGLRRSMSISGSRRITRTLDSVSDRDQSWLRVGVNVLVNGQVAAVRYVGPVHFADGLFLGLELRTADGKNDGSIEGKRYFTCKPNHGLMVRPRKVTVRGINAAKLLPEADH